MKTTKQEKAGRMLLFTALSAILLAPPAAKAQFLKKLGKSVAERAAEKGANKVADKAVDKGVEKIFNEGDKKEVQTGAAKKEDPQQPAGTEGVVSDIKTYSKFDFVPGEQVLYAEDFVQDNIGELPVNWNSNSSGVVVAVEADKSKWIELNKGVYLSGSKLKSFGNDYTIEWDMILNVTPKTGYYIPPLFFGAFSSGADDNADNKFLQDRRIYNSFEFHIDPSARENTAFTLRSFDKHKETFTNDRKVIASFHKTLRKVAHYALSVQGTRLRLWINEEKIADIPRAVNTSAPINQLFFGTDLTGGYTDDDFSYLVSNIKVAAGKPDTRSKLVTEGRFVTSGILFDVNSDQIKPQSYPVLKEIGDVMKENQDIKVKVIGHTDADGNAASNLSLSKKRAESVKNFIAVNFGIDAARLETDGLGMTKPVADNKTPAGKASNRRVEFVKL
ncbi:OmpA family protein [Pedobacter sp. JY14-1]|uniref:OmpA family protein n=1 Tax=Pedobacter sp. JY14-1 TaxID=3034151 RepID=UPI0023E269A2|nr:OmpA family protein [Pedobacter sp. JY14-1]